MTSQAVWKPGTIFSMHKCDLRTCLVSGVEETSCFQQQHLEMYFVIYLAVFGGFYCPDHVLKICLMYLNTRVRRCFKHKIKVKI